MTSIVNSGEDFKHLSANLLEEVPVAILAIGSDLKVIEQNRFAAQLLGSQPGQNLSELVHHDSRETFQHLLGHPGEQGQVQFHRDVGTLYTDTRCQPAVDGVKVLLVADMSEHVALGAQLLSNRKPERKFVHDMNNALTTTLGYIELINMMLEENDAISGERLAAIRRYTHEVYLGLRQADGVIKDQKASRAPVSNNAIPLRPKHVMVVDDEAPIAEFLSELLKARQYKVTSFTDTSEALAFYQKHNEKVDLVIMDQIMPGMSGISLATELLAFNINLPIVLCTGDEMLIHEQASGKLNIEYFISKPIDINELTDMVSSIIG